VIIHICPKCKGYLPKDAGYKYCVHCGINIIGVELLEVEIPDNKEIGNK